MAKVLTDSQHYTDIANAIREKNGETTQYKPSEMATAIQAIESGGADFSEVEYKLSNGYTDYSYMFYGLDQMTEVPDEILQNTGSGTNFRYMFYGCSSLTTIPQLDTSSGTDHIYMFSGCSSLTAIPQLDTSNSTAFSYMFTGCSSLTTIPQLDTSSGTTFVYMFSGCSKVVTIGGIDLTNAANGSAINSMFNKCTALENITINGTIKMTGLSFSPCTLLTHDSLMSIINAFYDYAAEGSTVTCKLTLGSTNLAKLTDAEKAIATQKGWTLA